MAGELHARPHPTRIGHLHALFALRPAQSTHTHREPNMTNTEMMLFILAEECAEVAQRASKMARFGRDEIEPGTERTNAARLFDEFADLLAVYDILATIGEVPPAWVYTPAGIRINQRTERAMDAKRVKVDEFAAYSRNRGTLTREPDVDTAAPLKPWWGVNPVTPESAPRFSPMQMAEADADSELARRLAEFDAATTPQPNTPEHAALVAITVLAAMPPPPAGRTVNELTAITKFEKIAIINALWAMVAAGRVRRDTGNGNAPFTYYLVETP